MGSGVTAPYILNFRTRWNIVSTFTLMHTEYEAGWAPEPVWTLWRGEIILGEIVGFRCGLPGYFRLLGYYEA